MSDRARLPTIGPVLWYRDPRKAIAWLEQAFGFECRMVVEGDDGSVMHSELTLGDGRKFKVKAPGLEPRAEPRASTDDGAAEPPPDDPRQPSLPRARRAP